MRQATMHLAVQQIRQRQLAGEPIDLVDVRSPGEFASGHVPGARNVPLGSTAQAALARSRKNHPTPLVLICESGGRANRCHDALVAAGITNAMVLEGGTAAWRAAGLPLERDSLGRTVIPLERQVRIAAGTLVLVGCGLGWFVHPAGYGLAAFVGAGLVFAGVTDFCGMGLLLARMPWNRR
jgi:rhodanese-related sulfurtransferase